MQLLGIEEYGYGYMLAIVFGDELEENHPNKKFRGVVAGATLIFDAKHRYELHPYDNPHDEVYTRYEHQPYVAKVPKNGIE